jgi:catechol 2,3-dioxygenase-like lactoylglutathione lyase family enzyme
VAIKRMEHVGIVVEDLEAAIDFFVELGLERQGGASVEGEWVDRVIGLDGVQAEIAMLQTPDGHGRVELARFKTPRDGGGTADAPSNAPGIRHVSFLVEGLDSVVAALEGRGGNLVGEVEQYKDIYRLCYMRGPAGIIIELAEELG